MFTQKVDPSQLTAQQKKEHLVAAGRKKVTPADERSALSGVPVACTDHTTCFWPALAGTLRKNVFFGCKLEEYKKLKASALASGKQPRVSASPPAACHPSRAVRQAQSPAHSLEAQRQTQTVAPFAEA